MLFRITLPRLLGIFLITLFSLSPVTLALEPKPLLEPGPDFKNNAAFHAILKLKPGAATLEMRKIEYLLERIEKSKCVFIRNGEKHDGKTAAALMRWKYVRYRNEIKTAEDFARKIANASRKSGEGYTVKMADGRVLNSTQILLNELALLDEALMKERIAS